MVKSVPKKKLVAAAHGAGDEESARARLLNAATRLFCRYGINATGIDAIIKGHLRSLIALSDLRAK